MILLRSAKSRKQQGFTIIELMIATFILSIILVLVSAMMIGIGKLFYKGISQSQVQHAVRNTTDDISQNLKLNTDNNPEPKGPNVGLPNFGVDHPGAYCIGSARYSFIIGKQIGSAAGQYKHVLWKDKAPQTGCVALTDAELNSNTPSSGGAELAAPRSRLTAFNIGIVEPYVVRVNMAIGDNDLLCDRGTPGDCDAIANSTHIWNPDIPAGEISCKSFEGRQFCSNANLQTTVSRRLTGE